MKTNKISPENIHKLILLADYLHKNKFSDTYVEHYVIYNKPPYIFAENGISFICFPFVYEGLSVLFPTE